MRARDVGNPLYDTAQHRAMAAQCRALVDAGEGWCAEVVCLMPSRYIAPGSPVDAAHDRVTGGYLGPAHPTCNRSEGGKEKHRRAKARRRWVL